MWEVVSKNCAAKRIFHKIHREIPAPESLSNTVKGFQVALLATLLKRDPTLVFQNYLFVDSL